MPKERDMSNDIYKNSLGFFSTDKWPTLPDCKVVWYRTLDELLDVYFEGMPIGMSDMDSMGGETEDGEVVEFSIADMKKGIRKEGVWGFIQNNKEIHIWARKNCRLDALTACIAHEVGHSINPHKRDEMAEERKAEKYELVAMFSVQIAQEMKRRQKKI
jgi:hypothetical protein